LRTLYGIVGRSVAHSLSPRGHNAGYRALDLPALYVPLRTDRLAELWRRLATSTALERLGVGLGGATIVAPHKEAALELADLATEAASRSGGANLLARAAEGWRADTTDVEGVLTPLEERGVDLGGAPVAVVGCGGAGRAAAFGLARRGAQVTIVNRDIARGRDVAARLGVFHLPLECFSGSEAAGRFAVVVHATPVGRSGDDLPFDLAGRGARARVLVDLVYRSEGSGPTVLVRRARALGWTTIDGREVLRAQIRAQFLGLTGRRYPCELHEILASSPHAHLDPA
jgi:3-dehydroquinate dehydratase/shikimate dehydrogenase